MLTDGLSGCKREAGRIVDREHSDVSGALHGCMHAPQPTFGPKTFTESLGSGERRHSLTWFATSMCRPDGASAKLRGVAPPDGVQPTGVSIPLVWSIAKVTMRPSPSLTRFEP